MASIIDALVVTLGLDASGFQKGQKTVEKGLKDTKDGADRAAKDMEAKGKLAAQFFAQIQNRVLALAATFTAGAGLKAFVQNVTTADAAVGRTARNIGVSTDMLTAWQGVAERTGGSADGMAGSMQGLSQQFQQLALTGTSQVVPYFRAVGVALADSAGKMRPMNELLLDLSDRFKGMADAGQVAQAQAIGRGMGLDEGTINVLLQGRSALQGLLAEQEKLGHANKADADAAAQRQSAWRALGQASEQLGRTLATMLTPAIATVVGWLTSAAEFLQRHQIVFMVFAGTIATASILLTAALLGLKVYGFLSLIRTLFAVPAAAAAAEAAMTGAAATSSASLLTMLGGLAKSAALLAAAGAVGYTIGTAIYSAIEDTKFADKLGEWITRTLAALGSSDAQEALDIKARVERAQRISQWSVTEPGKPNAATGGTQRAAVDSSRPSATATRASTDSSRVPGDKGQAEKDVQAFIKMGWTREQAAGIVANLQAESGGDAKAVGDQGTAFGLAQWHPDRQKEFAKLFGHDVRNSTRDEQLQFVNHELRHGNEAAAGRALSQASNAAQAAQIVMRKFERPDPKRLDEFGAKREGIANSLFSAGPRVDPGMTAGAPVVAAANNTNNTTTTQHTSTSDTKIGTVNVTLPNANDAESVAKGLGPALQKSFSFAAQANYGLQG